MGMKLEDNEKPVVEIKNGENWLRAANKICAVLRSRGYMFQARDFVDKAAKEGNINGVMRVAADYVKVVSI